MSITAEKDKKNWDWLPPSYKPKIIAIREAVTRLWNENSIKPQLPGFTPHGPEHSKSVEDIMHRLIPDRESFSKLTERERYYLLASAWLHDIGMICGIEEGDSQLAPEDIRVNHHKRSETFIVNNHAKICVDYHDAPAMGLLAHFHGEDLRNCTPILPVGTETVRLALLAAYLRTADALDISQSRSPMLNYAICLAYNIPMSSKLHWIKSRLISGIDISPKDHRITVTFKTLHDDDYHALAINVQKQNLSRLQKLVMNDLRTHIDSNSSVLVREGISYFLDIDCLSTKMAIDDQIRPELSRLVYNFEMMVHPSATKLMHILLDTINDIVEPSASGKDNANRESTKGKLLEDLQRFLKEIRMEILENRPCHLGLERLIGDFDQLFRNPQILPSDIKKKVDHEIAVLEKERQDVRVAALDYFTNISRTDAKVWAFAGEVARVLDQRKELESKTTLVDRLRNSMPDSAYINILLYGLSELVIKAISGLRDLVVRRLLGNSSIVGLVQLHKDDIEKIASTLVRIFVCEGQPKTITAKNDRLTYHDGTKYALELHRRGFNNVTIIPDLVAGSLLNDASSEGGSFMDYVMLGMNGLEYVPEVESQNSRNARFLHSTGHLAIATLARNLKPLGQDKGNMTRLILVLSNSKCAKSNVDHPKLCDSGTETVENGYPILKEGFFFRTGRGSKPIRTQPFLIRDEDVRAELFDAGISLYNPREDSVMLTMVDDIIADGVHFINIADDKVLNNFREWLYGKPIQGRPNEPSLAPR
jgi:hypothetical protein